MTQQWLPRKWGARRENRESLTFVLTFFLLTAVLFGFLGMRPDSFFHPLSSLTARSTGWVLGLLGAVSRIHDLTIVSEGFAVRIIPECTAVYLIILYLSFIITHPAAIVQKIGGILLGVPLLFAGNILRLAVLILFGQHYPGYFIWVHAYLGQVYMVGLLVFLAGGWLVYVRLITFDIRLRRGLFLFRFCGYASLFFLFWLGLQLPYMGYLDALLTGCFKLFGYTLKISLDHAVYHQTLNLVIFWAMIAATGKVTIRCKVLAVISGGAILSLSTLMMRYCNIMTSAFNMHHFHLWSHMAYITGQYVLPVLLWICFFYSGKNRFRSAAG